jgi:uncharacterized protein YcbK (DUF882 family)
MGDLSENFSRSEFKCKCGECDFDTVDAALIWVLEDVRGHFQSPVNITSGCRCGPHNKREGGSDNSQHLYGKAADITVTGVPASAVQNYLLDRYRDSFGIGRYSSWTHIDVRSQKARW